MLRDAAIIPGASVPATASRVKILSDLDIAGAEDTARTAASGSSSRRSTSTCASPRCLRVQRHRHAILDSSKALIAIETLACCALERSRRRSGARGTCFYVTSRPAAQSRRRCTPALNVLDAVGGRDHDGPVELPLEGIAEVTNPRTGLTFSSGLRSMMQPTRRRHRRQNPATASSPTPSRRRLTGHLVLSTLRTNDAAGAGTATGSIRASTLPGRLHGQLVEPHSASRACCRVQRRHDRRGRDARQTLADVGLDLSLGVGCARYSGSSYKAGSASQVMSFSERSARSRSPQPPETSRTPPSAMIASATG